MASMKEIEAKTKDYADARKSLADFVKSLEDEKRLLIRRRIEGIKKRVSEAKVAREALHVVITESEEQFQKPRTVLLHGIRVGFEKGKGKVEIANVDRFVERVQEHLEGQFDVLIKTEYKPVKSAIANLPAEDLKKLGVRLTGTDDQVVIRDATGDVDKLVAALLEDEEPEA